eukprot:scaffold61583_cov31-Phaeocystis_antarctica.AAC.1
MKESRNPATEERFVVRELGEEPQVIARVFADRRDRGGDHECALKLSSREGPLPNLHERGRLRQVEAREPRVFEGGVTDGLNGRAHLERARELGVGEGAVADRRDRGGDHERALKVGGKEGAVPDLHERGRLRQVE